MRCSSRALLPLLVAAACAGEDALPPPEPVSVEPAAGFVVIDVPIEIVGEGFYARAVQDVEGDGGDRIDATFRAWLTKGVDEVELSAVAWIDPTRLSAVVPAGIAVGTHDLRVEGPYGRGRLAAAYEGVPGPVPILVVEVFAPAEVYAGETAMIVVRATNEGPEIAGPIERVEPQMRRVVDDVARLKLPWEPTSVTLAVGEHHEFVYAYATTTPEVVELEAKAWGWQPGTGAEIPEEKVRFTIRVLSPDEDGDGD